MPADDRQPRFNGAPSPDPGPPAAPSPQWTGPAEERRTDRWPDGASDAGETPSRSWQAAVAEVHLLRRVYQAAKASGDQRSVESLAVRLDEAYGRLDDAWRAARPLAPSHSEGATPLDARPMVRDEYLIAATVAVQGLRRLLRAHRAGDIQGGPVLTAETIGDLQLAAVDLTSLLLRHGITV